MSNELDTEGSNVDELGANDVLEMGRADVGRTRERNRLKKFRVLSVLLVPAASWLLVRLLLGDPVTPGLPSIPTGMKDYLVPVVMISMFALVMLVPLLGAGRSPHVLYRPSQIDVKLDDVKGLGMVKDEVVKTLNLFLAHKTFHDEMGGNPRRAILFEGPPGTGKTYMAKAMAHEAGVPFLFVSSSAFQSMYYGQTNRKIRSYFRELRKHARAEGGAIGFIEEIDAIGGARSGMGGSGGREGIAGVVNELLIQLQSFDEPSRLERFKGWWIDLVNVWLPASAQIKKRKSGAANILVIGATNRAADLDPALLRPGRFDRAVFFDVPSRTGRREIIDFYLEKKKHHAELDDPAKRDALAAATFGYSPVRLEHLLDEALIWALRRGAKKLAWPDIQKAKMTEEIGLAAQVDYSEAERRTIATHEAGHATVAWLVGKGRTLDVLSIVKRRDALGLLQHSDSEERFTRTESEIRALIEIAFGGLVAEEIFFGEWGTGPSGDLTAATSMAAQMVGSLGMGGSFVSLEPAQTAGGNLVAKVLASDGGRESVEQILNGAKDAVSEMLTEHRHVVEALRDALVEHDELIADEILQVINKAVSDGGADEARWQRRSRDDRRDDARESTDRRRPTARATELSGAEVGLEKRKPLPEPAASAAAKDLGDKPELGA